VTEFGQRVSNTAGLFRIGDRPMFSCLVEGGKNCLFPSDPLSV
jgi:hypothetical protein